MPEVTEDTFLGDIISSDGKNTKNIKSRISKGIGIVTNIFNLLESISLGPYIFKVALLLRESMLINGSLTNAEIWYNLSNKEIKELENLDKLFFRKLLEVPTTTPSVSFYLELGVIPISVAIKQRRLNYLHHLLTRKSDSMLYSFFITQWQNPTKGDWTEQVQVDLLDFNIPCSFSYIQSMTKESFKLLVKTKAKSYALELLLNKKITHSKMKKLDYTDLEIQNYFLETNLKPDEIRTIFKYRTRMEKFGENFRAGKDRIMCPMCNSHLDNQELSLQCPVLKTANIPEVHNCDMEEIYKHNISTATIKTIYRITQFRKENLQ